MADAGTRHLTEGIREALADVWVESWWGKVGEATVSQTQDTAWEGTGEEEQPVLRGRQVVQLVVTAKQSYPQRRDQTEGLGLESFKPQVQMAGFNRGGNGTQGAWRSGQLLNLFIPAFRTAAYQQLN